MRFAFALLILIILQSCSLVHSDISANPSQPHAAKPSNVKPATNPDIPEPRFREGESISSFLKATKVRDRTLKIRYLHEFVDKHNKTIFIAVKPDCVFCETLLATMQDYSTKTKFKNKIVFFTDAKHASIDAFLKKSNEYSQIPATWLYDDQDKFAETFILSAFPRFLIVDPKYKLIKDQRGLVPPANRESLKGLEIAQILEKISEATVEWLKAQ